MAWGQVNASFATKAQGPGRKRRHGWREPPNGGDIIITYRQTARRDVWRRQGLRAGWKEAAGWRVPPYGGTFNRFLSASGPKGRMPPTGSFNSPRWQI